MPIKLVFFAGLLMLWLVGIALMQDGGSSTPVPMPTATWSPRAIEGIYQTLRVNYGLDLDNSSTSFPAHEEISTLIRLFAHDYLGSEPYMPYAAQIFTGFMDYDQYHRLASSLSEPLAVGLHEYLMGVKRPPMAAVGVREDGFAILYTARCTDQWCNTPQEYLKFLHQTGVLAVYVSYVDHRVLDANDATALIGETFPHMQTFIDNNLLRASEVEVFQSFRAKLDTGAQRYGRVFPVNYAFGVENLPRAAMVYAVVGVGRAFAWVSDL